MHTSHLQKERAQRNLELPVLARVPVWVLLALLALQVHPGVGLPPAGPGEACAQGVAASGAESTVGRTLTGTDVKVNPDGYTSARTCGRCHVDIYNSWKNSLHAFSLIDPIFDTAFMQAIKAGGDAAKKICLRCHAPMTMVNGDYDLSEGVTREGVSCDFCHTVTDVHINDPERPYSVDLGLVKRGIIKRAGSPAHEVAFSELHATSEFCGGCHNYVLENGTPVMTTYDEWLAGPYPAEGIQCQNCHMVLGEGKVVSAEIKESGPEVHLHNLIHDTDQLRSALEIEIVKAHRSGSRLLVEVLIKNVGSGHKVPTGMPSREIVLTVSTKVGSHTSDQERRYRKIMADAEGRILETDWEALLYSARIVADNRIGPREERLERFEFQVPRSGSVRLSATASYVYVPLVLDERRLDVQLTQTVKFVQ